MEGFQNSKLGSVDKFESCLDEKMALIANRSSFELIEDIYNNSVLLLHILSTSLQAGTLEFKSVTLNGVEFHMMDVFETVTSVFHSLASDKGISFQSFCNFSTIPNTMFGDSTKLSQIIMNLISNGVKYTKQGFVKVTCDVCNDEELNKLSIDRDVILNSVLKQATMRDITIDDICFVKVQCIDTGCGMSEKQLKSLFDPSSKQKKQDTGFESYFSNSISENDRNLFMGLGVDVGLGIRISKSLVDKMKGTFLVESELGKGTTFTLIIPFVKIKDENNSRANFENDLLALKELSEPKLDRITLFSDDVSLIDTFTSYINIILPQVDFSVEISHGTEQVVMDLKESEEVPQMSKQTNQVLIQIIRRGDSNREIDQFYITKPLKANELVGVFLQSIILFKRRLSFQPSIGQPLQSQPENCNPAVADREPSVTKTKFTLQPTNSSLESASRFSSQRILIVDDNGINRRVMERMIRIILPESIIDLAGDGSEAFEKFKTSTEPYDVIFMDLLMPTMSGKESCACIRQYSSNKGKDKCKIIAVTANIWESKQSLIEVYGFDTVLYKPILLDSLRQVL